MRVESVSNRGSRVGWRQAPTDSMAPVPRRGSPARSTGTHAQIRSTINQRKGFGAALGPAVAASRSGGLNPAVGLHPRSMLSGRKPQPTHRPTRRHPGLSSPSWSGRLPLSGKGLVN